MPGDVRGPRRRLLPRSVPDRYQQRLRLSAQAPSFKDRGTSRKPVSLYYCDCEPTDRAQRRSVGLLREALRRTDKTIGGLRRRLVTSNDGGRFRSLLLLLPE